MALPNRWQASRKIGAQTMTWTAQMLKDIFFRDLEIDNVHKDYSTDPGGGDLLLRFKGAGMERPLLQIKKKELPAYIREGLSVDGLGLFADDKGDAYLIVRVPRHFDG